MNTPDTSNHQLADLRKKFFAQLPDRIQEILSLFKQLQAGWNQQTAGQLQQAIHKVAGASLSLGYTRLGITFQSIEHILTQLANEEYPPEDDLACSLRTISERLDKVQHIIFKEKTEANPIVVNSPSESISAVSSLQDSRADRLLYLVEDDINQSEEIAQQIGYYGYSVKTFPNLQEMEKAIKLQLPAALLLDTVLPDSLPEGKSDIQGLLSRIPPQVHIIFISVRDDIQTRLKAVHAGGEAYFPKPVNIGTLIDVLDRMMIVEEVMPFHILIVDDDQVQATVNALHLKKAGMETTIITDPMTIIQVLNEYNPDLILLDMYMPECSGMDLAVIIRQIESFVSIPLVFLSSETDREKQLEAVGLGGDDFLTKPIKPEHLITAVSSRVERYRQLRRLMMRDSLTGLLNHTTLKERYAQEINRATRLNKPLTYAMIDLDNFKRINDTCGHAAGDRVLKSLASMLSKRLRNTDVIGRYGGEEFAILMPNTNSQEAFKILDEMRIGFEHILHRSANKTFNVTFSCGVASYPECITPSKLAETADIAVYAAKNQGRNRVIIGVEK